MRVEQLTYEQIHTGSLILVNEKYPYLGNHNEGNLIEIDHRKPDILLERQAGRLLEELMQKIKGWTLICGVSGWRSKAEQRQIWEESIAEHGEAFTKTYVAIPGHSEHHTGLAIDLGLRGKKLDVICPHFPYEGICQKFRRFADQFGFIQRYPQGREHITGIGHEPWHFRYVGVPHSYIMSELELTLEEYMEFLKQYEYGRTYYTYEKEGIRFEVSYLRAVKEGMTQFEVEDHTLYTVSGNNVDGFVVTRWR